jgi:hypothetical protein
MCTLNKANRTPAFTHPLLIFAPPRSRRFVRNLQILATTNMWQGVG